MKRIMTLISLIVSSVGLDTHATTLAGLSQDDLIRRADIIVHATPIHQISRWQGSRIVTSYTLSVTDYFAGTGPQEVQLDLLGGQVGGLAQHVSGVPILQLQEPKLLFLRKDPQGAGYNPIQLGLGVFSFDAIKNHWKPDLDDVHILGQIPMATSFNQLKARIKTLRVSK